MMQFRDRQQAITLMLSLVAASAACLAATGCAEKPKPQIAGRMLHTPEFFTGTSTASIDGTGTLTLRSNRGAFCSGPYSQKPDDNTGEVALGGGTPPRGESGVATLTCHDGRSGTVLFLLGDGAAVGTGMLGKDIVTLTIGD
jgi:hypothetical protein